MNIVDWIANIKWGVVAAGSSAVAAIANLVLAYCIYQLRERDAKRDLIKKFLRGKYDIGSIELTDSLNELPVVFGDAQDVMNTLAKFHEAVSALAKFYEAAAAAEQPPEPDRQADLLTEGAEILCKLLKAMCKDARVCAGPSLLEPLRANKVHPFRWKSHDELLKMKGEK